ncbi:MULTISPECIES: hypothetical protein [Streptomyces]|uniref:hypothetical protein n=1 Tax=Streptomyces TaxID=1883 RepID=UPI001F411412|nr:MULTISPECIES: hypothetical protein [Streptomyces]
MTHTSHPSATAASTSRTTGEAGAAWYVPGLEMRNEWLRWRVGPEGGVLVTGAVALRAAVLAVEAVR